MILQAAISKDCCTHFMMQRTVNVTCNICSGKFPSTAQIELEKPRRRVFVVPSHCANLLFGVKLGGDLANRDFGRSTQYCQTTLTRISSFSFEVKTTKKNTFRHRKPMSRHYCKNFPHPFLGRWILYSV